VIGGERGEGEEMRGVSWEEEKMRVRGIGWKKWGRVVMIVI
jgi:hypothetical protein